jgi:hypothetical protein
MFADDVFSVPNLTPQNVYTLDIRPGCNSLEIPIKSEMENIYVFRKCESTATKRVTSNQPLPYSTMKAHMEQVGKIAGFSGTVKPYDLRYGSGNAFDNDGKYCGSDQSQSSTS